MSTSTRITDSNAIDALKVAISHHNDAAAIMSSHHYDTARQSQATSSLTKVLRVCQNIICSLDDGNTVQSTSSGKIVQALLERCMNTQDLYGNEVLPQCRTTTTSSTSSNFTGNDNGMPDDRTPSGSHQIGNWTSESTLPQQEYEHPARSFSNQCERGFLYSKPIRIPHTFYDSHVIVACGVSNICMFLSCAATFNLALVHHLLAQDQSTEELQTRSRGLLVKAVRLYEICITLISEETNQQQEQEQQNQQFKDAPIFDLATTNNLGMALDQLNESEKAQQYFSLALSTLMCLICQTTTPGRANIIGQTILPCPADIDGFFRTASRIMSHEKAAPAA